MSAVAQVYDPDGYISSTIVIGKMIIQELWKSKVDWDQPVDQQIAEVWKQLWDDIIHLEKFRIDRWIGTSDQTKTKLIGFSDASQKAYGAVVYARTEYPDGTIKCHLLSSKTRVAPLKEATIPRLELSAAELLARLITELLSSMEFGKTEYMLFTDSSITLYWIRKPPESLKVFVSNRVASIQTKTDPKYWHYVNTKQNPADLLSRGVKPSELVDNKLWLHGPIWLQNPESLWPSEPFPPHNHDDKTLELKVFSVTEFKTALDINKENTDGSISKERVSVLEYADKLEKAQRILGYAARYVQAFRNKYQPPKRNTRSADIVIAPPSAQEKEWNYGFNRK